MGVLMVDTTAYRDCLVANQFSRKSREINSEEKEKRSAMNYYSKEAFNLSLLQAIKLRFTIWCCGMPRADSSIPTCWPSTLFPIFSLHRLESVLSLNFEVRN